MCLHDINAFNRNIYAYEYFNRDFNSKQTTKLTDKTESSCMELSAFLILSVHNGNGANELVKPPCIKYPKSNVNSPKCGSRLRQVLCEFQGIFSHLIG